MADAAVTSVALESCLKGRTDSTHLFSGYERAKVRNDGIKATSSAQKVKSLRQKEPLASHSNRNSRFHTCSAAQKFSRDIPEVGM